MSGELKLSQILHSKISSCLVISNSLLRLVFTSDGVGVGVAIRSVKRYDLVKIKQRSRKQSFLLRLRFRRLRPSENQFVGVVSRHGRTKPIIKRGNEHRDWFILPLLLPTPTIWFSLDRKRRNRKRSRKKIGKRSDSSDSDSVELMTPLTTPMFDFH